jgi:serine/threonine protein kinase
VRGKWEYFPPEIVTDTADERGDVWALGVTLYKLASGAHPFAAETAQLTFERARRFPPNPIDHLPRDLWKVIERALAKDPRQRYQRAQDFGNALEDFLCTCGERRSPRLLAAQLFLGDDAMPVLAGRESPSISMQVEFDAHSPDAIDTQSMEREEMRRFDEIFGPSAELAVDPEPAPAAAPAPRPKRPPPQPPSTMTTSPEMPAAPAPAKPVERDDTDYDDLYDRFIAMRPGKNQASASMSRERFRETLQRHRVRLLRDNPQMQIVFDVVFQDGKPLVRPRATRRAASGSG